MPDPFHGPWPVDRTAGSQLRSRDIELAHQLLHFVHVSGHGDLATGEAASVHHKLLLGGLSPAIGGVWPAPIGPAESPGGGGIDRCTRLIDLPGAVQPSHQQLVHGVPKASGLPVTHRPPASHTAPAAHSVGKSARAMPS